MDASTVTVEAPPPAAIAAGQTYAPYAPLTTEARLDILLAESLELNALPVFKLSVLNGDEDPAATMLGIAGCNRLLAEVRASRLAVAENLDYIEHKDDRGMVVTRIVRSHLAECTVPRAWFLEWIEEFGSPADKQSRAATWARHVPAIVTRGDDDGEIAGVPTSEHSQKDTPMDAAHASNDDNQFAFESIKNGNFAAYLAIDALSLRNCSLLLGDEPARMHGPAEQLLCQEVQDGRLTVDRPDLPLRLLHCARASREAVSEWLRTHATAELNAGRLAAWARYERRQQ
jgi:hypothetical protein